MNRQTDKPWYSFEAILAESWAMLGHGVNNAEDPFHHPVLGTTGTDGVSMRTVILRRVIQAERTLICHTDLRSGKVVEIQNDPRVCWLFYHPEHQVQLRLLGHATLHTNDPLADTQWAALPLRSRRIYCSLDAPGVVRDDPVSGLPKFLLHRNPTPEESEAGRPNFAVIATRVDTMDWLLLTTQGNQRAYFSWVGDEMTTMWLTP